MYGIEEKTADQVKQENGEPVKNNQVFESKVERNILKAKKG